MNTKLEAIFFDLDGTLIDTAPDMAYALNCLLKEESRAALDFSQIRPVVSHGALGLINLAFGIGTEHQDYSALRERFLTLYESNLCKHSTLFPFMEEVLQSIESAGLKWGIVTNKPEFLTIPLVEQLGLGARTASVISGDTIAQRKPHPEPLFEACRRANVAPSRSLYVGDAERDIQAGKAAGMQTVTALFGYIKDEETPYDWGADWNIECPSEMHRILKLKAG